MARGPFVKIHENSPSLYHKTVGFKTDFHGRRVPLPYTYHYSKMEPKNWDSEAYQGYGFYHALNSWGRGTGTSMSELEYTAWAKMRSQITSRVQMGVNLAEFGQTVATLAGIVKGVINPLTTVGNLLRRAPMKGRRVKETLLLGDVPNAYLAFQFGVKPAMSDAYDLIELLKDQAMPYETKVSGTARGLRTYKVEKGSYDWSRDEAYACRVKTGCTVSVSNPNLFMANQLGLINPVNVAWQLVPFSFIVDWFIPVGAYLSSYSDLAGLSVKDAYTSRACQFSTYIYYKQFGPWMEEWNSGCVFERGGSLLNLNPPAFVRIPGNTGQIISAGMLVLQKLGSLRLSSTSNSRK